MLVSFFNIKRKLNSILGCGDQCLAYLLFSAQGNQRSVSLTSLGHSEKPGGGVSLVEVAKK